MPLTAKGEKIKGAMEEQYGEEKGEKVFYASKNKGTITGVDAVPCSPEMRKRADAMLDSMLARFDSIMKSRYGDAEEDEKDDEDTPEREELRGGALSKDS